MWYAELTNTNKPTMAHWNDFRKNRENKISGKWKLKYANET